MNQQQDQGRYVLAVILIGLGIIFLLQSTGILGAGFNWWALFIALPGVIMLWNAYQEYQQGGSITSNVGTQAIIGGFLVLLAASFLFNLGGVFNLWPLLLIAVGLAMLFGSGQFGGGKTKQ